MLRASFVILIALTVTASLRAGDDAPSPVPVIPGAAEGIAQKKVDPEFPPVPKVVPVPAQIVVFSYQRTDTREVWQHYAPNRMGRMVPRVILTPYGALYSRTLEPYPWAGVRPGEVRPIIVN